MGLKACDCFCSYNCLTGASVLKSSHTLACPALRCELDNNRCSRGPGRFFGISANALLDASGGLMHCGETSCVHIVCVTGCLIGLQAVKQIDWIGS